MSSAVPDVHQMLVSTVDTRGRVRTGPLITMPQGFRPSPNVDAVATVNHAFLCMNINSCVIAPRLIGYASDTPASSSAVSTVYGSCDDGEPYTNRSSYSCRSAPVSQPDMRVYHHTALRGTGSFRSSGPHARSTAVSSASTSTTLPGVPLSYLDIGDCDQFCRECGALFWLGERLKNHNYNSRPEYHLCCGGGRIYMPIVSDPPPLIQQLLTNSRYMEHIRAYNQMFAMTSFGAKVDDTVNRGSGPYVFKVSGQVYHWMGSLCPEAGNPPRFLQLYIYDTHDEVQNRMRHFGGRDDTALSVDIVDGLIRVLDEHNGLVRLFRTARDRCAAGDIPSLKIRLYNDGGTIGYELPSSDCLGCIVFEDGPASRTDLDIIVEYRGGYPQRVSKLHQSYMSLQFPLMFIFGEPSFYPKLVLKPRDGRGRGKKVTMNEYYRYQLHPRRNGYGLMFRCGRLFQQYVVAVFCAIEQFRLDFHRKRQNSLRSDYLMGLYDAISRGDRIGIQAGSVIMLPRTFTVSPRYMYSHYLDALAICRSLGNPQYFITFTCNVKWPEIQRYMQNYPLLTPSDRADIVCRVFQQKVNDLIRYLKHQQPFGAVIGYVYTIEFQKRGLPHCHTLLWVDSDSEIKDASEIDSPNAPCNKDGLCTKKFPKPYSDTTFLDAKGHTHYRRRQADVCFMKGDARLDSSNVVPYNRELCLVFQAHINVEYCGWSMLIKYLFKYISKGPDRILATVNNSSLGESSSLQNGQVRVDEIQNYVDGRFICPFEAIWRILDYPIHRRVPAIQILNVHLENMQTVTFQERDRLDVIVNMDEHKKKTLTEWYTYKNENTDGHHLTYLDFPSEFVWYPMLKRWKRRTVTSKKSLGRLKYVHPISGDLFYFRMLLSHRKGCKSPIEVRTVDGRVLPTYRAACEALGLLADDKEWDIALEESAISATSAQLRTLFAQLLIYCNVSDPPRLWRTHWQLMQDDIPKKVSDNTGIPEYHANAPEMQGYILYELEAILADFGKSVKDFGLPSPPAALLDKLKNKLLMEEMNYDHEKLARETDVFVPKLNDDQATIYRLVINAVSNKQQELLFVYGHGGTGKTFLWKTIIGSLRSEGKVVLAVASSGIASLLLPAGRTAHSRFKLPLDLTDESLCHEKKAQSVGRPPYRNEPHHLGRSSDE